MSAKELEFYLTYEEKKEIFVRFLTNWETYFKFFSNVQEAIVVTPENEERFFNLQVQLALDTYTLNQGAKGFFSDHKGILEILAQTPSLETLSKVTDSQFRKFQIDWHSLFLEINKAMGLFERAKGKVQQEKKGKKKKVAASKRHLID